MDDNFTPLKWGTVFVPYGTVWSDEVVNRKPKLRMVTISGKRWRFLSEGTNRPSGKPVFGSIHSDRQLALFQHNRCQMCCRTLDGCTSVAITQGRTLDGYPLAVDGYPMHAACAVYAVRNCNNLRNMIERNAAQLHVVTSWAPAAKILRPVSVIRGGNAEVNKIVNDGLNRGRMTINGVDLMLLNARAISWAELEWVSDSLEKYLT